MAMESSSVSTIDRRLSWTLLNQIFILKKAAKGQRAHRPQRGKAREWQRCVCYLFLSSSLRMRLVSMRSISRASSSSSVSSSLGRSGVGFGPRKENLRRCAETGCSLWSCAGRSLRRCCWEWKRHTGESARSARISRQGESSGSSHKSASQTRRTFARQSDLDKTELPCQSAFCFGGMSTLHGILSPLCGLLKRPQRGKGHTGHKGGRQGNGSVAFVICSCLRVYG